MTRDTLTALHSTARQLWYSPLPSKLKRVPYVTERPSTFVSTLAHKIFLENEAVATAVKTAEAERA